MLFYTKINNKSRIPTNKLPSSGSSTEC